MSAEALDPKDVKAANKEGGKKGVDLQGVAAMGGVMYFNISVESCKGDLRLLESLLEGANAPVDESAEERKGGAGDIGKLFLSAGDKQVAIIAHVPKVLAESKGLTVKEWVETVIKPINGKIIEEGDEVIKAVAEGDAEKGLFPLKMRDEATAAGFTLLRAKGLVPDNDDDDDDVNYAEAAGVEW